MRQSAWVQPVAWRGSSASAGRESAPCARSCQHWQPAQMTRRCGQPHRDSHAESKAARHQSSVQKADWLTDRSGQQCVPRIRDSLPDTSPALPVQQTIPARRLLRRAQDGPSIPRKYSVFAVSSTDRFERGGSMPCWLRKQRRWCRAALRIPQTRLQICIVKTGDVFQPLRPARAEEFRKMPRNLRCTLDG